MTKCNECGGDGYVLIDTGNPEDFQTVACACQQQNGSDEVADDTTINVAADESAVVYNADGSVREAHIPDRPDDYQVTIGTAEWWAFASMLADSDEQFTRDMARAFESAMARMKDDDLECER